MPLARSMFRKFRRGSQIIPYVWQHPANRGRQLGVFSRAAAWQIYKRVTGRTWILPVFDGLELICHPDSQSASAMFYGIGYSDFHEMKFLENYLRRGDHVLDIGANVGVYTLLMASLVGPDGQVDAFEASPATMERLRENVERNEISQVILHADAVGANRGITRFTLGLGSINHIAADAHGDGVHTIEVPMICLDDFFKDSETLALMKIDIEGAELMALEGARELLARQSPPVLLLKLNSLTQRYGHDEGAVENWLEGCGYDLALFDGEAGTLRFKQRAWRTSQNVFAISREHEDWVRSRLSRGRDEQNHRGAT